MKNTRFTNTIKTTKAMRKISIILIFAMAITFTACNNKQEKETDENATEQTEQVSTTTTTPTNTATASTTAKEIIDNYLQLKNGLANDKSDEVATAGKALETAIKGFDKSALNDEQKKSFEDIESDAVEHAQHISANAGNIKHQREHFDLLSKDMYDFVKAFGAGQTLYKDFCPMYNDNKGAIWLSETKEIKNPYYGKAMSSCGSMKEELK